MAHGTKGMRTEHAGAKNGGGFFGPRADAKRASRKRRRRADLAYRIAVRKGDVA